MKRSGALEILKENYAHLCTKDEIEPQYDIWPEDREENDTTLNFERFGIDDQHISIIIKALKVDCFFNEIILTHNPIGRETVTSIIKLIEDDGSMLQIIRFSNSQINRDLLDDLWYEVSKAEIIHNRTWNIYVGDALLTLETSPINETIKWIGRKKSSEFMTPQQKSLNVSLDKEFAVNFMSPEFPNFISRSISPIEIKGADLLDFSNKNFNQIPKNLEDNGPKVLSLSDNKIDRIMNIPSTLLKLSLKSNVISRIENLDKSSKIRILDLSNNKITMIENLNHCKNLQELDLANNLIKIIENLDTLKELKRLGLEKNSISKLSSIRALSFNVNLNFLVLKENPIAAEKNYKPSVISLLPKLVVLDYKKLAGTQGTFRKIFNRDNQFFSAPIFKIDVTPEPTLMISHSKKSLFLSNTLVIPNPTSPPKTAETQTMTNLNKVKIDIEIQACPETIKKDMVRKPVLKSLIKLVPSRFKPNSSHELAKIRRFFKNVYIFKDIPSTFIETLINASIFYIVDEGEIVKYAEAITEQMIVIYRGKMQYLNRVLGSGANLFAESLVDPEEIEGDVVCIERCEFFVLCKQDLDNIIKNYPNYREAYMKNYLDKNVNPADINIRSQTFFKNPKKDPIGIKSQAKPVHSLNLKSLITSETSYQLGLIPHFKSTLSPLTSKIKYEVDSLYKDADPFDLEFPNHAKPGASKIEAVTAKVTRMFEIYKKERDQEAVSANIINEAKSFVKFGAKSDIELLALKRESLRKCIESCEEDGNEEFVNEYINMLI